MQIKCISEVLTYIREKNLFFKVVKSISKGRIQRSCVEKGVLFAVNKKFQSCMSYISISQTYLYYSTKLLLMFDFCNPD